jgi:ubiquinone/menaquinone biosynthesis C-methylase UbiE
MTPSTGAAQAERFIAHVLSAGQRSAEWLDGAGRAPGNGARPWLDLGTGTGDLATAAAQRGVAVTAIDVAMRWLVVAQRRAELAGVDVRLVCCNAEALPFPDASFARVVSLGTLEHCTDAAQALAEARRVLLRGGEVRLRTVNRYSILPEPHVGVWGVGYVPRRLADAYVRWRAGHRYEHHRPLSPREVRRGLVRAGFRDVRVEAAPLLEAERARLGRAAWMGRVYDVGRVNAPTRSVLRWTAPVLEASGVAA